MLNIWNQNNGIDQAQGPYTTWNPVAYETWHGDGSIFYCDKEFRPLPSIRLENFRDGMEDYAYACLLKEAIEWTKEILADQPDPFVSPIIDRKWLAQAQAALQVPEELVKDMAEYSHDPALLRAWREGMAEALDACDFAAQLNPWFDPDNPFGVRGFHSLMTR
jgi:hypothetical protein